MGPGQVRELVEAECARFGVPGAAVTMVSAGEVVLADGFGRRDDTEAVSPTTLFMLASDTKCFAALTLCLLVEDGLLDLDQPVRDHLPWFAMHDDERSGLVTCRDLLAHRTGLPRHALMTVGDGDFRITNEGLARSTRFLEASRPFRAGFAYNNVHYAVAGHVAEAITGVPWSDLLADRVLRPLGMTGTSTYLPEQTSGDFAAPHLGGTRLAFQARPYDLPSGGIVTHAQDLGRWLLARLGNGGIDDRVLDLLHAPVVEVPDPLPFAELTSTSYALGNMASTYRGRPLHLHGGSQIGFSSQVLVLPEAQVGVAVMTNTYGSRLPLALGLALVDLALGVEAAGWGERLVGTPLPPPDTVVPSASPSRPSTEHEGTFTHPAYGDVVVTARGDTLAVAFHGLDDQLVLTHVADDDWLLVWPSLPELRAPLSFRFGADGSLPELTLAIEPELTPLVFSRR